MYCLLNGELAVGAEYNGVSYPIVLLSLDKAEEMLAEVKKEIPNATLHKIIEG